MKEEKREEVGRVLLLQYRMDEQEVCTVLPHAPQLEFINLSFAFPVSSSPS
jgi:hypothetical protein